MILINIRMVIRSNPSIQPLFMQLEIWWQFGWCANRLSLPIHMRSYVGYRAFLIDIRTSWYLFCLLSPQISPLSLPEYMFF